MAGPIKDEPEYVSFFLRSDDKRDITPLLNHFNAHSVELMQEGGHDINACTIVRVSFEMRNAAQVSFIKSHGPLYVVEGTEYYIISSADEFLQKVGFQIDNWIVKLLGREQLYTLSTEYSVRFIPVKSNLLYVDGDEKNVKNYKRQITRLVNQAIGCEPGTSSSTVTMNGASSIHAVAPLQIKTEIKTEPTNSSTRPPDITSTKDVVKAIMNDNAKLLATYGSVKIRLFNKDITRVHADAIVNAANDSLQVFFEFWSSPVPAAIFPKNYGGVAAAISKAAGPKLQAECDYSVRKSGRVSICRSRHTKAYNLMAKHVIHTVGPRFSMDCKRSEQVAMEKVRDAYLSALNMAENTLNINSVAMPLLSCGIFGVPAKISARGALEAVMGFIKSGPNSVRIINLVDLSYEAVFAFISVFHTYFLTNLTNGLVWVLEADSARKLSLANVAKALSDADVEMEEVMMASNHHNKSDDEMSDCGSSFTQVPRLPTVRNGQSSSNASQDSSVASGSGLQAPKGSPPIRRMSQDQQLDLYRRNQNGSYSQNPVSDVSEFHDVTTTKKELQKQKTEEDLKRQFEEYRKNKNEGYSGISSGDNSVVGAVVDASSATSSFPSDQSGDRPAIKDDAEEEAEICTICMIELKNAGVIEELDKCKHKFHQACIVKWFDQKKTCPICHTPYGVIKGDQPDGTMDYRKCPGSVAGFHCDHYYEILYRIPGGVQGPEHTSPGSRYSGTERRAYLPDTPHANDLLAMLQMAFDHRLMFTIGTSNTTGQPNTVIWNGIHHKTNLHGGSTSFGYPDATYLNRLEGELASVGITRDMISK